MFIERDSVFFQGKNKFSKGVNEGLDIDGRLEVFLPRESKDDERSLVCKESV